MSAPLASLSAAASRLTSGGTIVVRGGTYPAQTLSARGTATTPLVIRAAAGETPVFDGAAVSASWSGVISLSAAENVVFDGLELRTCTADSCSAFVSVRVNNLTVRNCHIHHMDGAGMRFHGTKIRLEGNSLYDLALTNVNNTSYPNGGWPTCIGTEPDRATPSTPFANDVVIRGNRIVDCWGEGIGLWYASNAVVEDNFVNNSFNVGIYMDNAFNISVSRNFVQLSRGISGSSGGAILMASESYANWGLAHAAAHDITITNNIVAAGSGIGWWNSGNTATTNTYQRLTVAHNTVVARSDSAIGFDAVTSGTPPTECIAKNNVISERNADSFGAAWTIQGNVWLNRAVPSGVGSGNASVTATVPAVSSPTSVQALVSVVGTGVNAGVLTDFNCSARSTSAPHRGAFEQ